MFCNRYVLITFIFLFHFVILSPIYSQVNNPKLNTPEVQTSFRLQLLHAADMEGGIEALDNAPRFSSILKALKSEVENTVIIGAGDSFIPGPFFAAGNDRSLRDLLGREGSGRADILMLNAMGFMASALGNHEFDAGTATLASIIQMDRDYVGTAFPFLSANLDFRSDSNLASLVVDAGQEASSIPNSITKSVVITTTSGEKVGVVGITTPILRTISSPGGVRIFPEDPNDIVVLAQIVQESVDALTEIGINVIILAAHLQQISLNEGLVTYLRDVDIMIAGGSNTLLADETDRLHDGDTVGGPYPILTQTVTNEPIAIVGTDGNYKYVGRLVVEFDEAGVLLSESIDPAVSGAFVTDEQGVIDTGNIEPTPRVVEITDAIRNVVSLKDGNFFGKTNVHLNGNRSSVRTEETNIGNLTADANLATARLIDPTVVASLKNGGGIRASIGIQLGSMLLPPPANPLVGKTEGQISQVDIENTLRFNNALTLVSVTASQLLEVVEHSVAASGGNSTPGRFPQVAGFAFSYDTSQPEGSRVQSLVITDDNRVITDIVAQNGSVVGDSERKLKIVTLNFLADGGDDYPFPNYPHANPIELSEIMTEEQSGGQASFAPPGTEQDALAEYLAANHTDVPFTTLDVGPEGDQRIQNLAYRADTLVLPSKPVSVFNMQLTEGLNMISLPLMPENPYTARSFMEKIGATMIIQFNPSIQSFKGFTVNSAGNGFELEGGQAYIVNITESKVIQFNGTAWQNPMMAAPPQIPVQNAWAFVFHANLSGFDGIHLIIHNHRTGISHNIDNHTPHAVWSDNSLRPVVSLGDKLTIEVRNTDGRLIRTINHQINTQDIHQAFSELHSTKGLLKPIKTALFNNYPNPFNPETWIPYQLVQDSDVKINIYDPSGNLVRHLNLGFQNAGYYVDKNLAAYWDGCNDSGERLSSGIYYYQLRTNDLTTTRKMVILK